VRAVAGQTQGGREAVTRAAVLLALLVWAPVGRAAPGQPGEAPGPGARESGEPAREAPVVASPLGPERGPRWLALVSPTFGWLRNTSRFPAPVGKDADGELVYDEFEMTDDGYGGGLTLMGFYKHVSLVSVLFGFPDVNQASLYGAVTALNATIPVGPRGFPVRPYLGLGFVAVQTDADIRDFDALRVDELGGVTLRGHAHMDRIRVNNTVLGVYPKVGPHIQLPIQHWWVRPYYSFLYENVRTRARSTGGQVDLYEYDPVEDRELSDQPWETVHIRPFDSTKTKEYRSHIVGLDVFFDFHYFLQLRGEITYNASRGLWTNRWIGSMMFNRYVGLSLYFEHSQKITVTNTYFLVGPSFILSPDAFWDRIEARRARRAQRAREDEAL